MRRVEPAAFDWQHSAWSGGCFDMAWRPYTAVVEGVFRLSQHVILATIEGGADSLTVRSSCGHRFHGAERTGAISIVPADCERHLQLCGVEARWASMTLDTALFPVGGADTGRLSRCVSNVRDDFLFGLMAELSRLQLQDGALDPLYCESMSHAAAQYAARRYGELNLRQQPYRLTRWQLSRIEEFVDAHLCDPLRIADLAALLDCSITHFHRAFRGTCQMTPLEYINHRRIQRAKQLLRQPQAPNVSQVAALVGYSSVTYFIRLFRRLVGTTPAHYRRSS